MKALFLAALALCACNLEGPEPAAPSRETALHRAAAADTVEMDSTGHLVRIYEDLKPPRVP